MFGEKIPVQLVGSAKVTPIIDLSGNKLKLNEDGIWVPVSSNASTEATRSQVLQLERTVQQLQGENSKLNRQLAYLLKNNPQNSAMKPSLPPAVVARAASGGVLDEYQQSEQEQALAIANARVAELEHNLEEAEYRNRLLVAMCTISECDYRELCREADVDMRDIHVGEHKKYDQDEQPFSPIQQRYTNRR